MGEQAICPKCGVDVLTSDATCHGCGVSFRKPDLRCPHCQTGGLMILASKRFPGGSPVLITYMKCTNRECNTRVTAIKEE